jgi:hypothetical protein
MRSVLTSRTHNEMEWQSAYVTVRGSVNARSTWFAHLDQLLILSSRIVGAFCRVL